MRAALSLFSIALCAGPVVAQDAAGAIDFEALYAEHADDVVELMTAPGTTRWQLDLPGGIVVWADGTEDNRRFSAADNSGATAVGCLWETYVEVVQFRSSCPGILTEPMLIQMAENTARIGNFVADNTYPPVPRETFWTYWEPVLETDLDLDCEAVLNDASAAQMIGTLVSPRFEPLLDAILAEPRLPVGQPCF
jgi:hypothetical protein